MNESTPPGGEFALIDRIVERLGDVAASDITVPSGDDAAVWANAGGHTVASVDAFVEGTHFRRDTMSYADAGWRAVAATVSDIAAMGATPQQLLVTLIVGPALKPAAIDECIDGLAAACRLHEVRVAGGDIVRGEVSALAMTVLGFAQQDAAEVPQLLRRGAASAGDAVAVSERPGAASAGLALIEAGREAGEGAAALIAAHRRPRARVDLGRRAIAAGIRCGIDISDGLLQDLGHIAERSNLGVEIDVGALPLHPAAVELLGALAARDLALGGGEDFELALAGPLHALSSLSTEGLPVTVIGRIVESHPGEAWALDAKGGRYIPPSAGWDQLRST